MSYTHKKDGAMVQIIRDETVIALYDPVTEEIAYAETEFEKYSKHVGRVINEVKAGGNEETVIFPTPTTPIVVPAPVVTPEPTPVVVDKDAEIKRLKNLVSHLQVENVNLKAAVVKLREGGSETREPERFAEKIDLTGAPQQNPAMGDLTPEFVEWARKNMSPEVFEKRYKNRLK